MLDDLGFRINPVDGKIFYVLKRFGTDSSATIYGRVVYDGKESQEYPSLVYGPNWGKDFFLQ